MARKMKTITAVFYTWAAPYWINGDSSGLSEQEVKEADAFVEDVFKRTGCSFAVSCGTDSSFARPEIDGCTVGPYPAGNVTEYTFGKWEK